MRPPRISLVTVLSVFLLLSCFLGSAAGSARQQRPGRHRVVRSNRFIEARQPDGEPTDGYGPPPPYYTGEPAVPTEMTSYSTSEGTTATGVNTGSSEASVTSKLHTSFGNYTLSLGISTPSLSTGPDTNTVALSAASSAKAGGTTTSEVLTAVGTTASGSSHATRTSSDDVFTTVGGQIPTAWSNSTSPISTGSSAVTNRISDSISITGTATWEESSQVTASTTTTTRVFNTTVTVTDVVGPTGLTPSSTTYLTPINGNSIVATSSGSVSGVPSQTSTRGWTTVTISEENPTSVSTASGLVATSSAQDGAIGISGSESTQKTSTIASRSLNGTVSVTTTTYLTSTLDTATLSTEFSNQSSGSSVVISDGLSGPGTGEPSQTVTSMASSFSNVTNEVSTTITLASSDAESSASFTSIPALNGTSEGPKSSIATAPIQTSSVPLVASSALPVNATSNAAINSLTTTTVSEMSVITVIPGGVSPTANVTGVTSGSVSTDYSTSPASFFNSSMTRLEISSFQETRSLFDWSTSAVVESQHPQPTLGLPPISFTSFSFSIITTPMTPPSVATSSTSPPFENVTVIRSTWTSTITTSLGPTGLTSPTKLTAAHSTSGYTFSKTIESEISSVGSLSTSASNLTGIITSIITRQPTNLPFPTNTSSEWKSTMSSTLLTNSAKTINAQGPQTSLSISSSVMNTTAPYANSTSITNSATYSPPFGDVTSSKLAVTTYRTWNVTNTAQAPVNSTVETAISNTETKSSISAATNNLNWTATVTPPFPTTNHITLTTISGSVLTKTYTDVLVTIITPTDPVFWSSSIISSSLNNTPPFPFPSNTTVAGTGLPLPPTGTWTHPTIISSSGGFSTPYKESTSTSERKYHTSNATQHWSASGSSGFASGTNSPLFPSSNSTATATATFSSIVSWTPDPEPWTSWSTWDLTVKSGAPTSLGLPRVTTRNLSSETSESTSYTRTTTLFLTTTLAEPTASRSVIGNLSSGISDSTSYTRTTTLVLTTTLVEPSTSQSKFQNSTDDSPSSVSYTSTTTLFLTTTLGEASTSRLSNATITSTASTWMNTTLASVHSAETSTSLSEVSVTFLTTGSAKGIATSAGNSALTPFPVINSTLSQVTSLAIDTLTTTYTSGRSVGVTSPCESSFTTSSTCTDSLEYPPHGGSSADSITADCSTAHSMAGYNTAHWSNMTETFGAKDIDTSTYESLTTFRTVTTARAEESNSVWDDYPTPTDRVIPSEVVPADPNFPWGNDSPIHRHQNMSDVGIGLDDGGVSKRGDWRLRWENVKGKINSLWHGQTLESED